AVALPGCTANPIPRTASTGPNRTQSAETSTTGADMGSSLPAKRPPGPENVRFVFGPTRSGREAFASGSLLHQPRRRPEPLAVAFGQLVGTSDGRLRATFVIAHGRRGAAGHRREPDAEHRAHVGGRSRLDHAPLGALGGLERLGKHHPVLDVLQ